METIKCKSCGAVQEVSNETSSCNFCGSAIELQQSKDFYKEIVKSEFGNFLMMAETAEEATNYDEASKYYNKILEKDTSYSDAWLGKGNCLIYSSKIGDIKMKEALTYWKNAIKFAEHQAPMKLRVGKEINNVVNTFFPNLLNHYNEFSGLDDSYVDLAGRFLILEGAIDYAIQICPDESEFFQTGFDLCELVIKAPGASATSAQYAAAGSAIFNTLAGNKYSAKSNGEDWTKANERKIQIQNFGAKIQLVANKYLDGLVRLGVKSESDRPSPVNIKPIDEVMFKKLGIEYGISFVSLMALIFIIVSFGKSNPDASSNLIVLLIPAYLIYYFVSFNPRCKEHLGMSYSKASKIIKNK
ncbi:MAG: tetratricopeptide repeat protein [Flavobacterium sp.]